MEPIKQRYSQFEIDNVLIEKKPYCVKCKCVLNADSEVSIFLNPTQSYFCSICVSQILIRYHLFLCNA